MTCAAAVILAFAKEVLVLVICGVAIISAFAENNVCEGSVVSQLYWGL